MEFEKDFKESSVLAKKIFERNSFPFLYRTHCSLRELKGKKRRSAASGGICYHISKNERKKRYKKIDMVSKMVKYLSNIVFDEEFVFTQSRSSYREKIISQKKRLSNKASNEEYLGSADYVPELFGPPIEGSLDFNLFSIVHWKTAERQLPRRIRFNKAEVMIVLKVMWKNLSRAEKRTWKKLEELDGKRYLQERKLYFSALGKNVIRNNWRVKDRCHGNRSRSKRRKRQSTRANEGRLKKQRKTDAIGIEKFPQKLIVQYRYVNEDNIPMIQIEQHDDLRCPLSLCYCPSDKWLLTRCKISHVWLDFDVTKDDKGTIHLAVFRNPEISLPLEKREYLRDFSFFRALAQSRNSTSVVPIQKEKKSHKGISNTPEVPKKLITSSSNGNNHESTKQALFRQYYHSRTNLPMKGDEWLIDSDDESDDDWLHKTNKELIFEFKDVSEKEKAFMFYWNKYIKAHTVIADRCIPQRCEQFIHSHFHVLVKEGLRQNLLLHLCNLWDEGVLSAKHIQDLISFYDLK